MEAAKSKLSKKDLYQIFDIEETYSDSSIDRFQKTSLDSIPKIKEISDNKKNLTTIQTKKEEIETTKTNINQLQNITQNETISLLAQKNKYKSILPIKPVNEITKNIRKFLEKVESLQELKKLVEDFEECDLKKMATNTVFADGDENAEIMIIGEAPGNHEDLQGIPFCGDSGKMLNDMLEAIDIAREKSYISNTIFWRPPGNRNPTTNEIEMCRPFVEKHVALKKPKLIIFVGSVAAQNMLKTKDVISKIRGKFLDYNNPYIKKPIKSIPIFHPSYLMRQPAKKRMAWEDILKIKDFLNKNK